MNLIDMSAWPLWLVTGLFLLVAGVILVAGARMTRAADRLADLTGLGEAIFGAVLLGGSTSLPGIVTSVTTASQGYAELAVSNAIGGIAAQTTFLALADMAYREANLEHAAASVENLLQGALLSTLLAVPLMATAAPEVSVAGVNPASLVLVVAYLFGIRLIGHARSAPLWAPRETDETQLDEPDEAVAENKAQLLRVGGVFAVLALVVAVAGYIVAQTGITLAERTGLSETVVGAFLTAVATSLPELVTSVAAVRRGALTLAVGGIIGGNCFDVLFVAIADVAYRDGSIYHAMTDHQVFVVAETLLLTGILLMGLLRRQKHGMAGIGFESVLVLALYAGSFLVLLLG